MKSSIVGILLVVFVGGFVWWQNGVEEVATEPVPIATQDALVPAPVPSTEMEIGGEASAPESIDTTSPASTATPAPPSSGVTVAVVATHATRASCWSIINGNVYDLTSWIPKHPGGEQAILQLCGTDGSAKFNRKHGGDSAKENILFGFKVAVLSQ